MAASMKQTEAIKLRNNLKRELGRIERLQEATPTLVLCILPKLVSKEIQRLTDGIADGFCYMEAFMIYTDIKVPLLQGELMQDMLDEFDLSSEEATEKFKQALKSELEELSNTTVQIPVSSEFIQKVIDYVEEYLKKQRPHESPVSDPEDNIQIAVMDYNAAREKINRLRAERNIIRNRARAKEVDLYYLLQLIEAEIERLSDEIVGGILSTKSNSDEIKIPVEGASMLSRIPTEYDLSSAEETHKFTQKLVKELKWVTSLVEQFPLTFQFIQRVIGYVERYKRKMRQFEGAVFGSATDNQKLAKIPRRHSWCN